MESRTKYALLAAGGGFALWLMLRPRQASAGALGYDPASGEAAVPGYSRSPTPASFDASPSYQSAPPPPPITPPMARAIRQDNIDRSGGRGFEGPRSPWDDQSGGAGLAPLPKPTTWPPESGGRSLIDIAYTPPPPAPPKTSTLTSNSALRTDGFGFNHIMKGAVTTPTRIGPGFDIGGGAGLAPLPIPKAPTSGASSGAAVSGAKRRGGGGFLT